MADETVVHVKLRRLRELEEVYNLVKDDLRTCLVCGGVGIIYTMKPCYCPKRFLLHEGCAEKHYQECEQCTQTLTMIKEHNLYKT